MKLGSAAKTSLLIAVAAIASSALVVATRHRATTSETEARAKNLLKVWRDDDVDRLELRDPGRIVLERQLNDGGERVWRLKAPVDELADQEAVQKLIAGFGFATPARPSETSGDALGMDAASPAVEISVGSINYHLRLGKGVPQPAGAAYVELIAHGAPGSGIWVVPRDTAELFHTSADELRQRDVWPLERSSLKTLSIEYEGAKIELTRGMGSSFKLASGQRANRDAVDPLLMTLERLSTTRFLDAKRADAALASAPRLHLRAVAQQAAPVELELGGTCPDQPELIVLVRRSPAPLSGCVDASVAGRLRIAPEALADTRPFSVRADEVEELAIERDGKRLVLARKGSEFLLRQPSEAKVSLDAGNARLAAILGAPAVPFVNTLGFAPSGQVTVTSPGDGAAFHEVVTLGRPSTDGKLPLKREDGVVLLLDRDAARAFSVDSTLLHDTKLLEFSGSELAALTLSEPEPQKFVRNAAGNLELVQPKGFNIDAALAADLALALGALDAVRWVADEDDQSFGLEKPQAHAEIDFTAGDAGKRSRTLIVGSAVSGGNYARFEDSPGVFVIERELVEKLQTLLVDRGGFMVDPAGAHKVELARAGKRIALIERGETLAALEPATLPSEQARAIADALSALRADAAVHSGPPRSEEGFAKPELEVHVERRANSGPPLSFTLGASDSWRGLTVAYARVKGVDATFVIAKSKLRALFDVF